MRRCRSVKGYAALRPEPPPRRSRSPTGPWRRRCFFRNPATGCRSNLGFGARSASGRDCAAGHGGPIHWTPRHPSVVAGGPENPLAARVLVNRVWQYHFDAVSRRTERLLASG